ncbi:single-stranded-DNA-specific exonuclease RecJ [bacterium]|nr:single-stranded-DNA-specific exonuclease RecJ [bacterium]
MSEVETVWKARLSGEASKDSIDKFGALVANVLWARGITDEGELDSFLHPKLSSLESPFRLSNLQSACIRIFKALEYSETIAIYGDYDIDGMSALSILKCYFEAIGYKNLIDYIPHRFEEGYGMNSEAVEKLKDQGATVIITVDTGITAIEPISKAKELGIDVIVTDHHLGADELPETEWIINPNSGLDESGLSYLSGAGVAFYLCMGLNITLKEKSYFQRHSIEAPNLKDFLDLYSLGTISDQMKLVGENRVLVSAGLKVLFNSRRAGVRELVRRCIDLEKGQVTARDVGFSIGPKLNAASRLGKAHLSVDLLSCSDPAEARVLSEQLLDLNTERVMVQKHVFDEAVSQAREQSLEQRAPVLILKGDWHEGVLGIVASKIVEEFSKPTIVLTDVDGVLKGSMRSLSGISCVEILKSAESFLMRFGGHREAAGLQLSAENFDEFIETVWTNSNRFITAKQSVPELVYDMPLPSTIDLNDVLSLEQLAPFGNGNPEASFLISGLGLDRDLKIMKEQHVKFKTNSGLEVIGFFKAKALKQLQSSGVTHVDLIVVPEVSRFRGLSRLQLRLEQIRKSSNA